MTNISIFTPTFNRAYILERCYESLLKQSSKNFVWILVDDGSEDNTEMLVSKWQKTQEFKILYIKQQNGGKHRAHNTAVKNCETNFMLLLDSDDLLDNQCIEILDKQIAEIDTDDTISGIIGNKYRFKDKSCIGKAIPANINLTSGIELYQKYGITGDTLRLYKTRVLNMFLYPDIGGENFMYENVVFDQIDDRYRMQVTHKRLYYCEYLDDGYTANASRIKYQNPVGYARSLNSSVIHSIRLSKKINWTILYIIWCKALVIQHPFRDFGSKGIYIVAYPAASACYALRLPRFFFKTISEGKR